MKFDNVYVKCDERQRPLSIQGADDRAPHLLLGGEWWRSDMNTHHLAQEATLGRASLALGAGTRWSETHSNLYAGTSILSPMDQVRAHTTLFVYGDARRLYLPAPECLDGAYVGGITCWSWNGDEPYTQVQTGFLSGTLQRVTSVIVTGPAQAAAAEKMIRDTFDKSAFEPRSLAPTRPAIPFTFRTPERLLWTLSSPFGWVADMARGARETALAADERAEHERAEKVRERERIEREAERIERENREAERVMREQEAREREVRDRELLAGRTESLGSNEFAKVVQARLRARIGGGA